MHVMGGFERKEAYYVPRVVLETPWSKEELCSLLLPNWERWQREVNSPYGDQHGKLLVEELLPFLVHVAVQDGIYWLRDFPNHPCPNILKQSLLNPVPYETWAIRARRQCDELETSQPESSYEALSDAVVLSNNRFARRQDMYHSETTGIVNDVRATNNQIRREQRELFQKVWELSNKVDHMSSLLQQGK
mgnify:CR=1 FL=1